jgi:hypothetical protein
MAMTVYGTTEPSSRAAPPNMTRLQCPPLAAATTAATVPVVARADCRAAALHSNMLACQTGMGCLSMTTGHCTHASHCMLLFKDPRVSPLVHMGEVAVESLHIGLHSSRMFHG